MNPFFVIKSLIRVIPYRIIHLLSVLFPRNKNIWVFIGWRQNNQREIFAENVKYFYLHAHNNLKDVRPIWIGLDNKLSRILRDKGYEAYSINSIKGIYYSLRAGYTFYGALPSLKNWSLSKRSKVIQLWHGKSAKKTVKNSSFETRRLNKHLSPHVANTPDKIIAISNFLSNFTASDFGMSIEDTIVTGIPKYDCLIKKGEIIGAEIDNDKDLLSLIEKLKSGPAPKVFLYAPTFRRGKQTVLESIDFNELDKVLRAAKTSIIMTLHPKLYNLGWSPSDNLKNIHFVDLQYDIYPIMHKFDALITDFSSLAVDFLYMGKPVTIYAPDQQQYKKSPGLHEKIWSALPEPKLENDKELFNHISNFDLASEEAKVKKSQVMLFDKMHDSASENIVDFIKREIL